MMKDSGWSIQCDFDGTISVVDVTDALLARFARPGWQQLEDRWVAGEIGSAECMAGQVALLDVNRAELDEFLDGIQIDPHFAAFASAAGRLGIPLEIASDGLDHAIHRVLRQHGLAGLAVHANRLVQDGERRWRMSTPYASPCCVGACGTCKCELLAPLAAQRKTLFIGDGRSDFCVSGKADFVLAKGALAAHCADRGIAHAAFDDFSQALATLHELAGRSRAAA